MRKFIDLTGCRFGKITVLRSVYGHGKSARWLCRCDCGNEKQSRGDHLLKGEVTTCGKYRCRPGFVDLAGHRYGNWTVLRFDDDSSSCGGRRRIAWICRCDCGNTKSITSEHLRLGGSNSCKARGCHQGVRMGMSRGKTYHAWKSMLARCYKRNNHNYRNYGGRGITVCKEWSDPVSGFLSFLKDMGPAPTGMTLDRINPDGNYERSNCRWVTPDVQRINRRKAGCISIFTDGEILRELIKRGISLRASTKKKEAALQQPLLMRFG